VIQVGVLGAAGRMGQQVVSRLVHHPDLELCAAIVRDRSHLAGTPVGEPSSHPATRYTTPETTPWQDLSVVIDFSNPEALVSCVPRAPHAAWVIGTTGLPAVLHDLLTDQAARSPVLVAANFSTGIAVLLDLVARAAAALPDDDVEIVEVHHNQKRDAPSGTALALGQVAAAARGTDLQTSAVHGREGLPGARRPGTIGFHAVRAGGVVGEHEVIFGSQGEVLRLAHSALDRGTFADGAVRAAHWLARQAPGRYTLRDVLGLTGS
jgi:4-hydroxy-tetrahydrodipicolinate reductase